MIFKSGSQRSGKMRRGKPGIWIKGAVDEFVKFLMEDILGYPDVDREFHDPEDVARLRRFWHKVKVRGQELGVLTWRDEIILHRKPLTHAPLPDGMNCLW